MEHFGDAKVTNHLCACQAVSSTGEVVRAESILLDALQAQPVMFSAPPDATATLGILLAICGGLLACFHFLETRRRQRLARTAADFARLWDAITSQDDTHQALGIAGLQQFLTRDRREYHEQVVSILAVMGRLENSPVVQQSLTLVVLEVMRALPVELRRRVSWRGLKLPNVDLRGVDLSGMDLREAMLAGCDLSGRETNLTGAHLQAACLRGTNLREANLVGAHLDAVDLTNAELAGADLSRCEFRSGKLRGADFAGANLSGAKFSEMGLDWSLARHWRTVRFDPRVEQRLLKRHGLDGRELPVLMLMWEFPPFVAGGAWTATYHLVRNLRKVGVQVTLLVPWPERLIDATIFGDGVDVWAVGDCGDESPSSLDSGTLRGGRAEAYGNYGPLWIGADAPSGYSDPGGKNAVAGASATLLTQVREFLENVQALDRERFESRWVPVAGPKAAASGCRFDVIHAHDWLTFRAAKELADRLQLPWVAHFHSLEADRRPIAGSRPIREIERTASEQADVVIVPSKVTRNRLRAQYPEVDRTRLHAVANCSSDGPALLQLGEFSTRRVVYVGRFGVQKRPDLFVRVATTVRLTRPDIVFVMYGSGDVQEIAAALELPPTSVRFWLCKRGWEKGELLTGPSGVQYAGSLEWQDRSRAYENASLLIVPSQSEPFGMVILEAMQHGIPVMYTATAGAAEYLENAGIPYDPTDVEGAAKRVIALLDDVEEWRSTVAGQDRALAEFRHRDGVEEICEIWSSTICVNSGK